MLVTITPAQRKKLLRYEKWPVTLKQYYAAQSLLSLGKGKPLSAVAKTLRRPEAQIERWALGFEKAGVAYVSWLGRKDARPSHSRPPGIATVLRLEKKPAPDGLHLDADPADLYRCPARARSSSSGTCSNPTESTRKTGRAWW